MDGIPPRETRMSGHARFMGLAAAMLVSVLMPATGAAMTSPSAQERSMVAVDGAAAAGLRARAYEDVVGKCRGLRQVRRAGSADQLARLLRLGTSAPRPAQSSGGTSGLAAISTIGQAPSTRRTGTED